MSALAKVKQTDTCKNCNNCMDVYYSAKNSVDICKLYLKESFALISALQWLLEDDHKHGDTSMDLWTQQTVKFLHEYIRYLYKCLDKSEMPLSFDEWLVNMGLVKGRVYIRKPDFANLNETRSNIIYVVNEDVCAQSEKRYKPYNYHTGQTMNL